MVKDALKKIKYNVNIYLRVLDFLRHFIVSSSYIYKDFSYYLLRHYIKVVLL